MKLRAVQLALVVFLAAVAGCLGALGAQRWLAPDEPAGLHEFVHDKLELTSEQEARLDALEERYAIEVARLELDVWRANASLAAAMEEEHRYGPSVSAAIDEVHGAMGALQKATVRHVFDMRAILDERQQRAFDRQVARSLTGAPRE